MLALATSGAGGSASHQPGPKPVRVPDGAPAWSPDGRFLVFYRGYSAYLTRPDGTHARRVGYLTWTIWSPDGRRLLLYDHKGRIHVARPDGTEAQFVARAGRPSWSPDNRFFAFASGRAIVIGDADGGPARRLEIPPGEGCPPQVCVYGESSATWSPAGDVIAFRHVTVWTASKGSSSLWTVGSDGSNVRRLPSGFDVSLPAWSPTGAQIAFIQYDDFEHQNLHVVDIARNTSEVLARAWDFVWSPRGDMIVSFGGSETTNAELFRLRDGWSRRLPRVRSVSWSPDGQRMAFERNGGIWIADRLGNRQRRVATGRSPSWSPLGGTIAFAAASCGPRQGIWLLRVATGATRRVTRGCAVVG